MSKQTHRERARDRDGFESFFPDPPTSPARADATRRRMSRDRTVVQRRYDNTRIRGDKGRGEKKGERTTLPQALRDTYAASARHRLAAGRARRPMRARSGGAGETSVTLNRNRASSRCPSLSFISFLRIIFKYNAAFLLLSYIIVFSGSFFVQCLIFFDARLIVLAS